MQSYQEDEHIGTFIGAPGELIEQMPPEATHHVIGKIPERGDQITINGFVWTVERVKAQHGWMRLRLLGGDTATA